VLTSTYTPRAYNVNVVNAIGIGVCDHNVHYGGVRNTDVVSR